MARSAGYAGIISAGDMRFPAGGVLTEDLIGTFVKQVEAGADGVLRFTLQDANGDEHVVEGVSGLAGMVELFGGPYETAAVTLAAPGWREYDQIVFVFTDTSGGTHVEAELFTHLLIEVERSLEADDHLAEALGSTGAMTVMPVPGTDDLNVQVFRLNPAVGDTMRVYGWRAGGAPGAPGAPGSGGGGAQMLFGAEPPDNALGADDDTYVERTSVLNSTVYKKASGAWEAQWLGVYGESPRPRILVYKALTGVYRQSESGLFNLPQEYIDQFRDYYISIGIPPDQLTPAGVFAFFFDSYFQVYDGLEFEIDIPESADDPGEPEGHVTMFKPVSDGPWSYLFDSRSPWAPGIPNVLGSLWNPTFPVGETATLVQNGITYGDTVTMANGIEYWPVSAGDTSRVYNGYESIPNQEPDWPGVHHIRAR